MIVVAAEPVFDEEVDGLLMSLPGCNPLSDGPDGPKSVWCKVGGNGTVANASVAMGWNASTSALPAAATAAVADPLTTNDGSAMTMTADDSAAAPPAATTAAVSLTASISEADSDASFPTAAPSAIPSSPASDSDDNATAAASSTFDVFSQLASALPAASSAAAAMTTDNDSSAATDTAAATNAAAASSTSSIDPSAACSMYSNLSVAGCSSAVAPATTEYAATTTVMADADWSAADMSVITTLVTLTISV